MKLNIKSLCFLEQSIFFVFLRLCLAACVLCSHLYCGGGHRNGKQAGISLEVPVPLWKDVVWCCCSVFSCPLKSC